MGLLKDNEMLEGVNIDINKELGRGSYTVVYEAEWRGLSCVAKVFHNIIFPNRPADTWKQLAREIELLQNIRHPNIVQLLGFIPETQSKIPSIVMERLDTNLTRLIEEHHSLLSFDMQVCILHDVAVGLSFLHGHKEPIIHRDLSSNNILLTDHLVAKISDLGLAKHIKSPEQQAGSSTGFGTQDYMPPEVLGQRPPQISPNTDVFSFGVVMLQISIGKPPDIRGILNVDTEEHRRKHQLDLLSKNNSFRPLILQCLSRAIDRPNAIALCEALKKFGAVRNSTLNLTKTFQEEKDELMKHLQLQRESMVQNMQNVQEQLQQKISGLVAKLEEEKRAALLQTQALTAKLNDVLDSKTKLQKKLMNALSSEKELQKKLNIEKKTENELHAEISQLKDTVTEVIECQSLNTIKQLVKQNQELTDLLERTNSNLHMYKIRFNELLDSLNKEHVPSSNIDDTLQKCKEDRESISVKLQDMEHRVLLIKQSLQNDTKTTTIMHSKRRGHHSGVTNKVGCISVLLILYFFG